MGDIEIGELRSFSSSKRFGEKIEMQSNPQELPLQR